MKTPTTPSPWPNDNETALCASMIFLAKLHASALHRRTEVVGRLNTALLKTALSPY